MTKKNKKVQRVKNSNSEHRFVKKPIFTNTEKDNIQTLQKIIQNDLGGSVTFHFFEERYNISTNKTYKRNWKEVLHLNKTLLERTPTEIIKILIGINTDKGASYFTIN